MPILFQSSGFLIQAKFKDNENYLGLHENVWPLNLDLEKNKKYGKYLDDNFFMAIQDNNKADLCTDISFITDYYQSCVEDKINVDLLFCLKNMKLPNDLNPTLIKKIVNDSMFIGYDYAYNEYDYYSALFSDIYTKRISKLMDIKLNKFEAEVK